MTRVLFVTLDSVGCGGAPDAAEFGDEGANTLLHIAQACAAGRGDRAGLRSGPLALPNLDALGLGRAIAGACGVAPPGLAMPPARGIHGHAVETARGKDTPSGHWELAGAPAERAFGLFPPGPPSFPRDLIEALVRETGVPGLLGNRHAPGVEIVEALGAESVRSGKPICYTSADSVFQVAAHEEAFGLDRLYDFCRVARRLCDPLAVGRVIARPFLGDAASGFRRTAHRKDFAMPPPPGNLLERAAAAGRATVSVGKIGDVFAHRDTGRELKGATNDENLTLALDAFRALPDGGLAFVNLVDFDTDFGHRRDPAGYAAALEAFDRRVPEIEAALREGDLALVTADHGNDPTFRGTDHTRECVPVLAFGPGIAARDVGRRASFADVGASLAAFLGLPPTAKGARFL